MILCLLCLPNNYMFFLYLTHNICLYLPHQCKWHVFIYLPNNYMSCLNCQRIFFFICQRITCFIIKLCQKTMSLFTYQRTMFSDTYQRTMGLLWEQCDRCGPRLICLVYLTKEQYAIHSSLLPVSDFFVGYLLCPFDILFWFLFRLFFCVHSAYYYVFSSI
jgi:hypothetical protein